jgi:hypothetical protein
MMSAAGGVAGVHPLNSPTVAIVDDETLICALLTEALREWGQKCIALTTAPKAPGPSGLGPSTLLL